MARIIVCDDAMFVRESLIHILEQAGHEIVAEPGNGEDCIREYKVQQPDIVLMDITMPKMDGIETTRRIHEIDPNAKIIMVSAMGHREKVIAAVEAGAKDFVVKPFEAEKVIRCVEQYI